MKLSEPTSEDCSSNKRWSLDGVEYMACWYPQMGGYAGKCIVSWSPEPNKELSPCFDAYIWHDGEFPFSDDGYRFEEYGPCEPIRVHHCDYEQFIRFGEVLGKSMRTA